MVADYHQVIALCNCFIGMSKYSNSHLLWFGHTTLHDCLKITTLFVVQSEVRSNPIVVRDLSHAFY